MIKNNDKKYILKICELLAVIGIIVNTIILMIIRETWTYEKVPYWDFNPTPKSSIITIIQYNPVLEIVYVLCSIVLLLCGVYRLIKHIKKN